MLFVFKFKTNGKPFKKYSDVYSIEAVLKLLSRCIPLDRKKKSEKSADGTWGGWFFFWFFSICSLYILLYGFPERLKNIFQKLQTRKLNAQFIRYCCYFVVLKIIWKIIHLRVYMELFVYNCLAKIIILLPFKYR